MHLRRTAWAAFILGGAVSGCVSDSKPKASPAPWGATPGTLAPSAQNFVDTDGDRYRDTTTAVVYVYADSGYPISMKADGTFEFKIETPGGKTLAVWTFDRKQTRSALRELAPGPGFVFSLSLLDLGSDRIEESEANLQVTFTPVDGKAIRRRLSAPLLIGPLSRSALAP
jgi:hypothetical protein